MYTVQANGLESAPALVTIDVVGASTPSTDLDGDGRVTLSDVAMFIHDFGSAETIAAPADFDGDRRVGIRDLILLRNTLELENPAVPAVCAVKHFELGRVGTAHRPASAFTLLFVVHHRRFACRPLLNYPPSCPAMPSFHVFSTCPRTDDAHIVVELRGTARRRMRGLVLVFVGHEQGSDLALRKQKPHRSGQERDAADCQPSATGQLIRHIRAITEARAHLTDHLSRLVMYPSNASDNLFRCSMQ